MCSDGCNICSQDLSLIIPLSCWEGGRLRMGLTLKFEKYMVEIDGVKKIIESGGVD